MAALSVPLRAAAAGSRAAVDPIKVYSPDAATLSLSLSLSCHGFPVILLAVCWSSRGWVAGSFRGFTAARRFGSDPGLVALSTVCSAKITSVFLLSFGHLFGRKIAPFRPQGIRVLVLVSGVGILSQILFSGASGFLFVPGPLEGHQFPDWFQCPHP
jgi:hypothetical protein